MNFISKQSALSCLALCLGSFAVACSNDPKAQAPQSASATEVKTASVQLADSEAKKKPQGERHSSHESGDEVQVKKPSGLGLASSGSEKKECLPLSENGAESSLPVESENLEASAEADVRECL